MFFPSEKSYLVESKKENEDEPKGGKAKSGGSKAGAKD